MSIRRQFPRFLNVGVVSTALDYLVMVLSRRVAGLDPVVAALAGYCCGGLLSYVLNRRHTFSTQRSHMEAGWRFAVVMGVGFALTGILMALLADKFGLPYVPARLVTTAVVFIWNFLAHRMWTFAPAV
ncbi:MAG TPA: GtrA family protein [Beijerinckiaceae bacterium]|nr:GtrA family protein [Beijerinckiaceae bacterium]